jgi:glutathione S-transferase
VAAKLYWFEISHPSQAARAMLDLKGVDYEIANVLPGNQKVHLRMLGFRRGTVPALKLDGRRVQGSREIARALDELRPDPPLFPGDPEARRRADEIERWGDEEFQNVPRRILRWGMTRDVGLRRWLAEQSSMPAPGVAARTTGLVARYYARDVEASEERARKEVESIPRVLDRVDGLLADGTLSTEQPNAVTYQLLCTVRALGGFDDFAGLVASHPCDAAARKLFPEDFTASPAPRFVPPDWLPRS